ncbi:MAG: hemolysin family protein [Thermogutta sp.]
MVEDQLSLWLSLLGLGVACVASTGTRALSDFPSHDLEDLCRKRNRMERMKEVFAHYRRASIASELVAIVAVLFVVATAALNLGQSWHDRHEASSALSVWRGIILESAGVGLAILFATVFVPRAVSLLWSAHVVYYGWPLWRFLECLMTPFLFVNRVVEVVLARSAGVQLPQESEEQFEEEIRTLVSEGEREGLLEGEAREMIEGVIKLSDVNVSEIMTPRTEMMCVSTKLSWDEMLELVIREGHSRIPVYEETRDNIVGILYVKDLLPHLARASGKERAPWTSLLREPFFVPETKPVDALMQEFQQTRNHMAIVLDEYGGVSGVITLEDILEEIVGEIGDELDQEAVEEIQIHEDGRAEVQGYARVEEINRRLDLALPEHEEYDTIAGLLMTHLGRVPHVGESVVFGKVCITVVEGDRRRIRRVVIEPIQPTATTPPQP